MLKEEQCQISVESNLNGAGPTDSQRQATPRASLWKIGLILLVTVAMLIVVAHNVSGVDFQGENGQVALETTPNIKHGYRVTDVDEFPFTVFLIIERSGWFKSGEFKATCTGIIVHKKWVLTARHCVKKDGYMATDVKARAGIVDRSITCKWWKNNCQDKSLKDDKIYVHPHADIALVRVSEFSMSDAVNVVKWDHVEQVTEGQDVIAIGWGITEDGKNVASQYLKKALMKVASRFGTSKFTLITVEPRNNDKDGNTASGDSGGPLVDVNKKLVGVEKVELYSLTPWVHEIIRDHT